MTETNGSGTDRPPEVVAGDTGPALDAPEAETERADPSPTDAIGHSGPGGFGDEVAIASSDDQLIIVLPRDGEGVENDAAGRVPGSANLADPPWKPLWSSLTGQLISALSQTSTLAPMPARELLLTLLRMRMEFFGVADHDRVQHFFADVVVQCSRRPGGLEDLGNCLEILAPGDPGCEQARRLVEQMQALQIEAGLAGAWVVLREGLRTIPIGEVHSLVLEVTDGRVAVLPGYCLDTWSAFIHLVGQNGSSAGPLPPWMEFLEVLRVRLDSRTGTTARDLLRRLARAWDCTDELEHVRGRHEAQTPRLAKVVVLTVVVNPNPSSPGELTLHSFQRWDDDTSAPQGGEDVKVGQAELTAAVEALIHRVEETWAQRSVELAIEFVLPLSLINEPVEWWPKESSPPPPTSLALYHTVVVRSFERMRNTAWHRAWRSRWDRLQQSSPPGKVRWIRKSEADRDGHVSRLEAELRREEDYVAVVLSSPPSAEVDRVQEIVVALRAGIPLILWHRGGQGGDEVTEELAQLLTQLTAVPEAAAKLRRRIEEMDPAARQSHPGREISVLWDNAQRPTHVVRAGEG